MHFYYEDIKCFIEVCHILECFNINFEPAWRYIESGRVEFIIRVELED